MSDGFDEFMGGGGQTVPFEVAGATVSGLVLARPEKRPQTDIDSGEAKHFPDGSPMYMFVVRIQTDLRDPDDPTDTGERVLYLKWKSLEAVRSAIRLTGASASGSMPIMVMGKAPSRLLSSPPVVMRRVAARTSGWDKAARTAAESSVRGRSGLLSIFSR